MNDNKQTVTVKLVDGGKFRVKDGSADDLNPKALILCGAAKCAGFTIMGLLKKDKITPKTLEITVEGMLDTPTLQPGSHFRSFNVIYDLECDTLSQQDTVSRAVTMAQEKYCGTIDMLRKIAPVAHEISIVSTETVKV